MLCVHTHEGGVQLWDLKADRQLANQPELRMDEVRGVASGCVARGKEEVWLIDRAGKRLELSVAGAPSALSWSDAALRDATGEPLDAGAVPEGGWILVAAGEEVVLFDAAGQSHGRLKVSPGASAVAATGPYVLLGYPDGSIELVPRSAEVTKPSFSFERVPASPVLRIVAGPMGTVMAGYGSGLVGAWDQHDGARLRTAQLHGPVVHLLVAERQLHAATELGSHLAWDLSVFHLERCELLREIWQRVPVVWQRGHAAVQPPPDEHPCRP
jgi:hypothetical protein